MLTNYAVLKDRLNSLVLDGAFPDECLVRDSPGHPGHSDFHFQQSKKPVGLVRLPCAPAERDEMGQRINHEIRLLKPTL